MSFQGVMRPGHVELRVLDLPAATNYYVDVLGLKKVTEDEQGRVYFKAWDETDHHSVVLKEADEPGMHHMAFKVTDDDALAAIETKLERRGIEVERIAKGEHKSCGPRIRFVAPTGHRFELYADKAYVGNGLEIVNPDVWPDGLLGMAPTRLDHCLVYGEDLDGAVSVFTETLGFALSEKVVTTDGKLMIAAFLTCSNKPHDIAFIRSPGAPRFHHASFWLESWSDVQRAADIITKKNVSLDIGPTRHGITRGLTIYFFDPSGNRNEVFTGGYFYYPDRPTLTWTEDSIGKAIFYYERCLNERFLAATTPGA